MKHQVRDAFLYVIIALAIVAGAILIGLYDAEHGLTSDRQMQWIAAGIFTCFTFGLAIKTNLKLWRSNTFFALLLVLFLIHTPVVIWLVRVELKNNPVRVPLVLYMFISILEVGAFNYACARLSKRKASIDRHLH